MSTSLRSINENIESVKLRALRALLLTRLTHNWNAPYVLTHAYTLYPSLICALRALRAFILINRRLPRLCFVLLQIPLSLSAPSAKKFNIARTDHGHTQRWEFLVLDRKHPFWANSAQNIKIVSLSCNLVPRPVHMCRIQWWCSLFLFSTGNTLFG